MGITGARTLSNHSPGQVYVGTAGWAVPAAVRDRFPSEGSALERYAARLPAAEINSSFHRSHRPATYARWDATVPPCFRFAVKLPKAITHGGRLVECDAALQAFAEEVAPLAAHRGPTLVQLPPSLAFDAAVAARFFDTMAQLVGGSIVCEPRHASWFAPAADRLLADRHVARVAADPARTPPAARPGGWPELVYYRLHGSPRMYRSSYSEAWLEQLAREVTGFCEAGCECWVIFDNTASGAAAANALDLAELLSR